MQKSGLGLGQKLFWLYIKGKTRWQFPTVEPISTSALASWLAQGADRPHLIDTRKPQEFAVSHLPGARNVATVAAMAAAVSPDQAIVVYCSVGYRSARFAEKLQKAGFQRVFNLEGSIFQWANEGRSLVCHGAPTLQVHPYNPHWGQLLKPTVPRAYGG